MKFFKKSLRIILGGIAWFHGAGALHAQPDGAPALATNSPNNELIHALKDGKFSLNVRLRYEYADQQSLDPSHAITVRPRFGYTTAPVYGFQGMIEVDNLTVLEPRSNYNAAGSNHEPGKTAIADPPATRLSQAWLSYSNWNSILRGGNQRIVLDNHRFIGDSGWRQLMQTFSAATIESKPLSNLSLFYGYIWYVNRVYGDVDNLPIANEDFRSDSHLLNASYTPWKYGKVTAYSYLLHFNNSPANSSATYGASYSGTLSINTNSAARLNYRGEYARQTDYKNQPVEYAADYWNVELGGEYDRFSLSGGCEMLGSDDGKKAVSTPLATLHAFNGWGDVFINTPAAGLRDLYASFGVNLPGKVPLRFIYHKYDADVGSADFGQEFDAVASRKFGKYWTVLMKYAYYDARDASPPAQASPSDAQKFWAQVEFNY